VNEIKFVKYTDLNVNLQSKTKTFLGKEMFTRNFLLGLTKNQKSIKKFYQFKSKQQGDPYSFSIFFFNDNFFEFLNFKKNTFLKIYYRLCLLVVTY
jgi:hypothetical protein